MKIKELLGYKLGNKLISYNEKDVILYALAVGASSSETSLIYERELKVLPTFGCVLGLWAVEYAGEIGAYNRNFSLHASQSLEIYKPLPKSGKIETTGKITNVWDKGKAALIEITTESKYFIAKYGIFLPGLGGWSGERVSFPKNTVTNCSETSLKHLVTRHSAYRQYSCVHGATQLGSSGHEGVM